MSSIVMRCKYIVLGSCLLALGCAQTSEADADPGAVSEALRTSSIDFDVALRTTGSVNIHATVYTNTEIPWGDTILAVHGLIETGAMYAPLAQTLFADRALRRRIKRVVAIDLPGHGDSGFPENLPDAAKFGDLKIEDNVDVVLQSIDALRRRRLAPQTIIGHSMGGLEVQAVQQALLARGSSLAARGIRSALLLAPVPPHAQTWTQPPASDLSPFLVQDPTLGTYIAFPSAVGVAFSFSTLAGTLAPNAPTPDVAEERGYFGPEPLTTLLQLVESPIALPSGDTLVIPRPTVDAGAFAPRHGTRLSLLSFAQDTLVPAGDLDDLYTHLSGDTRLRRYHEIVSDDAVHAMFASDPEGMLDALRASL